MANYVHFSCVIFPNKLPRGCSEKLRMKELRCNEIYYFVMILKVTTMR